MLAVMHLCCYCLPKYTSSCDYYRKLEISILCLLVPSASYLCKQFGPRSEPTKFPTLSVLKKLDTLVVFFKNCKITQATKIEKKKNDCPILELNAFFQLGDNCFQNFHLGRYIVG